MDLSSIALQGIELANAELDAAASAVAQAGAAGSQGSGNSDAVDLSAEMVAMMTAQAQLSAGLEVIKTADEIQQNLIDITA
jgi:flagellar hook protein FlgE